MSAGPEPRAIVHKLDTMVAPAAEPENAVLVDDSRLVRWAGPTFALLSLLLAPWTVYLAITLPRHATAPNYDVAWSGFDVMLLTALAATAYTSLRRSRYLSTAATAAAVLLVVDSWFDVLTSTGGERLRAVALAAVIQLPLAALCLWLSRHAHQLASERLLILLRRTRDTGRRTPPRD